MAAGDACRINRRTLLRRSMAAVPTLAGGAMLSPVRAAQSTPDAFSGEPHDAIPALVAGNTAFAVDLYAALLQHEDLVPADGNLLFSPFSISQALAMTYAGASGETAIQMAGALHFTPDQPDVHAAFYALNADLARRGNVESGANGEPAAQSLLIANALWGERTYPFREDFTSLLAKYYGTAFERHDFKNAPEGVRQQINGWVAEQTHDRIQDIIPVGGIEECTRLLLANAIWFYGVWESPFNPDDTSDDSFFLLDGKNVSVPFMFNSVILPYARRDGFQVVELSYAESRFAFTVFLPDEGQFTEFEKRLDPSTIDSAIEQLQYTDVLIHLPKFKFELKALDTGGGVPLNLVLQAMGMTDAFDPTRADFRQMLDGPLPETNPNCMTGGIPPKTLAINSVLHKAFIAVDERSTEAAATTVVIGIPAPGAAPPGEEPIEVRIDRPFLFAIRDTQTGTLLFLGRVMDPSA